jgi:hypothetical protein
MAGSEIDRLVIVFDANFKAMEEKLNKVLAQNAAARKKLEETWNGKGLTAATEKGFDSLLDKVGEAAKANPGFGAALGALGPAGLVAAAGIGGFALAMEQTAKAVEYAAGIEKLSQTIGVSTDFIQQFNFAAKQSEVDVGAADQALKNLNASLGAVQGNLPRAKQLAVVFKDALHMTPDDLRGYRDVGDLLPVIADRIKDAGSYAEQAAIAKKLGIEELLPLLRQGAEGFNHLAQEARDLGLVMDQSMIEKGAEVAKKLKEMNDVMEAQKNQTFVHYADTIIKIKTAWDEVTKAFLRYLAFVTGTTPLDDRIQKLRYLQISAATYDVANDIDAKKDPELASYTRELHALELERTIQQGMAEKPPPPPAATTIVTGTGKPKHTPKDETGQFDKAAEDAYESTLKELATAQAALTTTVEDRAISEKAAVNAEADKKLADLQAELVKIGGAEVDTKKQAQKDRIGEAIINLEQARLDKIKLIDTQTANAQTEAQIRAAEDAEQLRQTASAAEVTHLRNLSALANTAKDRADLERRALALEQDAETKLYDSRVEEAKAHVAAAAKLVGPEAESARATAARELAAAQQARALLPGAQADATAGLNKNLEGPIQKYSDSLQDLNTVMAQAGVDAAKSLSAGLADAIVNAKNLGDVASNEFKQLIQQVLQAEIEKNIAQPILLALGLPTAAEGTLSGAGLTLVGERGPELVRLPGGSQVISNSALRNVAMGSPSKVGPTFVFDNRGAVIWEQAARQMMAYADRAAASAGYGAVGAARQITPEDLSRSAGRRLS